MVEPNSDPVKIGVIIEVIVAVIVTIHKLIDLLNDHLPIG